MFLFLIQQKCGLKSRGHFSTYVTVRNFRTRQEVRVAPAYHMEHHHVDMVHTVSECLIVAYFRNKLHENVFSGVKRSKGRTREVRNSHEARCLFFCTESE